MPGHLTLRARVAWNAGAVIFALPFGAGAWRGLACRQHFAEIVAARDSVVVRVARENAGALDVFAAMRKAIGDVYASTGGSPDLARGAGVMARRVDLDLSLRTFRPLHTPEIAAKRSVDVLNRAALVETVCATGANAILPHQWRRAAFEALVAMIEPALRAFGALDAPAAHDRSSAVDAFVSGGADPAPLHKSAGAFVPAFACVRYRALGTGRDARIALPDLAIGAVALAGSGDLFLSLRARTACAVVLNDEACRAGRHTGAADFFLSRRTDENAVAAAVNILRSRWTGFDALPIVEKPARLGADMVRHAPAAQIHPFR